MLYILSGWAAAIFIFVLPALEAANRLAAILPA
jgi:hypothetical protein